MFCPGKAYFTSFCPILCRRFCVLFVGRSQKMLPELYTIFFAGEAEAQPQEKLRTQSQCDTPLIHEECLPTIPEKIFLGSERVSYHDKVCRSYVHWHMHHAQS